MKIVDNKTNMMDFHNVAQGEVFVWRDDDGKNHYFIKADDIETAYGGTVWNAVCLADGEHEHFNDVERVQVVEVELVILP